MPSAESTDISEQHSSMKMSEMSTDFQRPVWCYSQDDGTPCYKYVLEQKMAGCDGRHWIRLRQDIRKGANHDESAMQIMRN
jgi:hypothetical protein